MVTMAAAKPVLRAAYSESDYQRRRQELTTTFGPPDAPDEILRARRDQAFAGFFLECGWTQEKIAKHEKKDQRWVSYRLCFARFLYFVSDRTMVLPQVEQLTERAFREFWQQTDKSWTEEERFQGVMRLMRGKEAARRAPVPAETVDDTQEVAEEPATEEAAQTAREPEPAAPRPTAKPKPAKVAATPQGRREGPQLKKAREAVRPKIENGERISTREVGKELGVSHVTVDMAIAAELASKETREEAEINAPIDTSILSKPMQERFAILERRLVKQFDMRVEHAVRRCIEEEVMPHYKERLEEAERVLRDYNKPPFTVDEYRSLIAALHPDCQDANRRTEAFALVKSREMLLRPEKRDQPLSSGLPKTLAELLARKKTKKV